MIKEPKIFIEHILESIKNIESFSKGISKDKFTKDRKTQSAVVRELEIIGEATKNLTLDFVDKYPNVEWKKIAGLRDKLIHHYFGVRLDRIWKVIQKDIPKLKKDINEILNKKNETK